MLHEYPKWLYTEDGRRALVDTPEEQEELGRGWGEGPTGPFNRGPGRPPSRNPQAPDVVSPVEGTDDDSA